MDKKQTSPALTGGRPDSKKTASAKPAGKRSAKPQPSAAGTRTAGAQPSAKRPAGQKRLSKKQRRLRRKRIRLACAGIAVLSALMIAFYLTTSVVGGRVYLRSVQSVDLRGQNLTGARGVARLTGLTEAVLSDNGITDASPLAALTRCRYIDLTGNPVTSESYARLRDALPSCLILCEAEDYAVTELSLGGYALPGAETLARVFESHRALRLVDLRGTNLTQAEADAFRSRFPQITFVTSDESAADSLLINLSDAGEAADRIAALSGISRVTISGCAFTPDEYRALSERFSGVQLDCLIALGGEIFPVSASELDLSRAAKEAATVENLRLFPRLNRLILGEMLPSEAIRLKAGLGIQSLTYLFGGQTITAETQSVDLTGMENLAAAELETLLSTLPQLQAVALREPGAEVLEVIDAHRERVRFVYDVHAFGRTFSTDAEIIDLGDDVEDDDVEELEALLNQLPLLKEAHMYESRLSQESMDRLFDGYPEVFFGWTFRMCKGKYVVRTDITAFGSELGAPMHTYTQENFAQLRYCKNLMALDLGHNAVTNLDFLKSLTKLKLLILGDNALTDISAITALTELEYLELFMNYDLTDYSPLISLKNLTELNVRCPGGKRDRLKADAFMSMTWLERFWASSGHFSDEEEERLRAALPECEICVTKDHSTGDNWRGERTAVIKRMVKNRVYEQLPPVE